MTQVLIYNLGGQEILGRVSVRHAITMLSRKVARVHTAVEGKKFGPFDLPAAVELVRYIYARWVYQRTGTVPYSKSNLRQRDRDTCAYCGGYGDTVDHVMPRCQGGRTEWTNVVVACSSCNSKKAGRTPRQAGMVLRKPAFAPTLKDIFHPIS